MNLPSYQKKHFPVLNDRDNDLQKRWYVSFYLWDAAQAKFVRKTDFSMNHIKTLKDRKEYCKKLIEELSAMMMKGAVANAPVIAPKNEVTWKDAFEIVFEHKKTSISKNTLRWYVTLRNAVNDFFELSKKSNVMLIDFSSKVVYEFLDFLKAVKKVDNKTYNNYMTTLSTVFAFLVEREYIKDNPCKKIKKLGVKSGNHTPYTNAQISEIKKVMNEKGYDTLLIFVQFIYYTLARPKELKELRVRDIGEKTILFRGAISKNKKSQFVVIPDGLEKIIQKEGIRKMPADFYVFGVKGKPSEKAIWRDYFYSQFAEVLKYLGLVGKQYTIYSFKHTAVINLFQAGVDIKDIQVQCRHSSIAQTDTYLKDLGLIKNDTLKANYPQF